MVKVDCNLKPNIYGKSLTVSVILRDVPDIPDSVGFLQLDIKVYIQFSIFEGQIIKIRY